MSLQQSTYTQIIANNYPAPSGIKLLGAIFLERLGEAKMGQKDIFVHVKVYTFI